MATVAITIKVSELDIDIRTKSHQEVAAISDPVMRYASEAGNDKTEEIHRCVYEATGNLRRILRKFLEAPSSSTTTDDLPADWSQGTTFNFTLNLAERRQPVLMSEPLTTKIHEYIVDKALDLFYRSVSQPQLADSHSVRAAAAVDEIKDMVYNKIKPTVSRA